MGNNRYQLEASNIDKRYGKFNALKNVSIGIRDNEFLSLLGPSGSGKTTLLMIMAGFSMPSGGRLLAEGVDITRRPPEKRNFGMVFQGYSLFPHMTVADNVSFPLRIRKMSNAERRRKVDAMLETVGLGEHKNKRPSALSGGQQQRVAIARSLVFEPDILLLDEPLSALDKNLREQLQVELRRIHEQAGTTFVFVTHDQSEALALSSRIAIFDQGGLLQVDKPDVIYNRPSSRFIAEFLGRVAIFPLYEIVTDNGMARGRFDESVLSVPIKDGERSGGGKKILAVRPEYMTIHGDKPQDENSNIVKATVNEMVYQGATTTVVVNVGNNAPTIALPLNSDKVPQHIARGSQVWLNWPVDKGIFLDDQ